MLHAYVREKYDIRPLDFQSGKRMAIPKENHETCACCGRRIVKVNELDNGDKIGSECAFFVDYFKWTEPRASYALRFSEKQAAYLHQFWK